MFARLSFLVALLVIAFGAQAAPKIQHWTLDNGTRVYFVESRELPMVQLAAVFDAGSAREPENKAGLARLTARMLSEGAGAWDTEEIARRLEGLGAQLGAGSGRDMATVSLRSLTDKSLLEPALEVFTRVLTEPTFPAESFARERRRLLAQVIKDRQQPGAVASKAFFRELYRGHPYASDPGGTEQGLAAIQREDLAAHHQRYYVGGNAILVIVGDLSTREAKRVAKRVMGPLPPGEAVAPLPEVPEPQAGQRRTIPFPSSQSHVLAGETGIRRDNPDYFPLLVGNYTLGGGGFVSRILTEVREKRGLSYSAYSYFSSMQRKGPFVMGLQTKNAQRDDALKVLRQTLEEFVAKGPTPEELHAAKRHLTGAFALATDSNAKIADALVNIGFYRLPLTYLDDYIPSVEAVTLEQVRTAFKRHVDPQRLLTVVVGGAAP